MSLNINAPVFTPQTVVILTTRHPIISKYRDGDTPHERTLRRSARRLEALRRRRSMVAPQQATPKIFVFPYEYLIAAPSSILFVQHDLVRHFEKMLTDNNPSDPISIKMDGPFCFKLTTTKKNDSGLIANWVHAIVSADPARNHITIHSWYSNGVKTMFHQPGRTFAPVSLLTVQLDNTDVNSGEIEYTYDHSFVHGKTIEYGHVSFRDGLKNALCAVEFY